MYKSHLEVLHEFISPEVAVRILSTEQVGVSKNSWSLFSVKFKTSGLQLCSNETLEQVFSCEFCEIFQHNLFTEYPGQLLLSAEEFNL